MTESCLEDTGISARTVRDLWSDIAEQLCNSIFVLQIAEYNAA